MFLFDISCEFDRQIKDILKDRPNVCRFALNHERKKGAIEATCNQVLIYERKYRTKINVDQRNQIVRAAVKVFLGAALAKKREELMSDAALSAEQRKFQARRDAEANLVPVTDREEARAKQRGE